MSDQAITAAEQKEVRAMLLDMVKQNLPESVLDAARKSALQQIRRLKVESAGPAKATKQLATVSLMW